MSIVVNKTRLPVTNWQTKSGAVVSIDDARQRDARSLKVHMLPHQDLHGYDNPWPAGGGVNLFDAKTWGALGTNPNCYQVNASEQITVTASDSGGISNRLITLEAGETYCPYISGNLTCKIFDSSSNTLSQASGMSFVCPADGKIAVKLYTSSYPTSGYFEIVKGSTAPTAWSPYSNICPITGYQGVVGYRTGKNLFGGEIINGHCRFDTKEGQTYTVTAKRKGSNDCYLYVESSTDDFVTMTLVGRVIAGKNENKVTFTAQAGVAYSLWSNSSYSEATDVQIELGSTASSYQPYTGTTYPVSFPAVGVNQWDEEYRLGYYDSRGVLVPSATTQLCSLNMIPVKPNTEYRFVEGSTASGTKVGGAVCYYTASKEFISRASQTIGTFTTPNNCYFIHVNFGTVYGATYNHDISINYPATAGGLPVSAYFPYCNAMYKGYVDYVRGIIYANMAYIPFKSIANENWNILSSGSYAFYLTRSRAFIPAYKYPFDAKTEQPISTDYVYSKSGNQPDGTFRVSDALYIVDYRFETKKEFRAHLAQSDGGICYYLNDPFVINLTPQQIQMLVRDNTIWSDADSVEVEYAAIHAH